MGLEEAVEFTVLLDKEVGAATAGFESGYTLRGAPFFRSGSSGVADSVRAVQEARLLQVPAYLLVNGRAHAGLDEPVWSDWHDTLGERLTLQTVKDYGDIKAGDYVVDVQNGGLFVPRPDRMLAAIQNRRLITRAFPIGPEDIDLLLGDRTVYRWTGASLEEVKVNLFPSYSAFLEASKDPKFLNGMPVYAVVRTVEEARENLSGYQPVSVQLVNPDIVIPSGGERSVKRMLLDENRQPHFQTFGSRHDGYKNINSGRVVVLYGGYLGVNCDSGLYYYVGRSVGIGKLILKLGQH